MARHMRSSVFPVEESTMNFVVLHSSAVASEAAQHTLDPVNEIVRRTSPLLADFVAEVCCKLFWSVIPSL